MFVLGTHEGEKTQNRVSTPLLSYAGPGGLCMIFYCQALVSSPVPLDPNPPKKPEIHVQLGLA